MKRQCMSKYHAQLTEECPNANCLRIFCRRHHSATVVDEIVQILSGYKDKLECRNIEFLLKSTEPIYLHPIIDVYFYTCNLIYSSNYNPRKQPRGFSFRRNKMSKNIKEHGIARIPKKINEIRPCLELEHSYCCVVGKNLSPTDFFLLTGVVHLLLKKFQYLPNFNICLIVIRLFIHISKVSCLDQSYYPLMLEVYDFVYKKLRGSIICMHLAQPSACSCSQCLFQFEFSKADFENSVKVITAALNASIITNIRENSKMRNLLSILKILNDINEKTGCISYERFYLSNFCNKINLRTEFKFYRSNYETALKYTFILPIHIKAEMLKMANRELMKCSLQDAFFRALFEGVIEPYLFLTIRRDHLYEDSLKIIKELKPEEFKKQLKVKFVDEDGVDSGGIRKEYFQLLSQAISHDDSLFVLKNNRIWLKPGGCSDKLSAVGKIVGMALYNDAVLNIPFSSLIFKKILKYKSDFEDLKEIEPEHFRSILNLERCTAEELKGSELFFTVQDEDHHMEELIPGGASIPLTPSNFSEFKAAYAHFYTERLVQKELEALLVGFDSVIGPGSIDILRHQEVEKIIIGLDDFDFDVIRSTTTYNGYTEDSRVIKDFWSIVNNYNIVYKRKLLQFITGNDRLPAEGSKSLKLIIIRNGCDTERLPSSQTCFNTLLLPEYSNKDKLARKLSKALKLTAGFFLI